MSLGAVRVDDDLLHALLSFAALSVRTPIVSFFTEMAANLDQPKRKDLAELLVKLFRAEHQSHTARNYADYQPQLLPVPARYAAQGANLMILAVCAGGNVKASELYETQESVVTAWHSQALLWRSQLNTEEWTSLVETFTLSRLWDRERRDIQLTLDDGTFQAPNIDPCWTYDKPPGDPDGREKPFYYGPHSSQSLRRKAYFQCGIMDDIAMHALEPLASTLMTTMNMFLPWKETSTSAAHALLDVWLLPLRSPTAEERRASYERCAMTVTHYTYLPGEDTIRRRYTAVLLDRLATDEKAPATLAGDILDMLATARTITSLTSLHEDIAPCFVRCALAFLGRDRDSDQRIAKTLLVILPLYQPADTLAVEACIRLAELNLPTPLAHPNKWSKEHLGTLQQIASRSPDLVKRLQRVTEERSTNGPMHP
jgi:hypothetical protein